jgi:hypothetical protein
MAVAEKVSRACGLQKAPSPAINVVFDKVRAPAPAPPLLPARPRPAAPSAPSSQQRPGRPREARPA